MCQAVEWHTFLSVGFLGLYYTIHYSSPKSQKVYTCFPGVNEQASVNSRMLYVVNSKTESEYILGSISEVQSFCLWRAKARTIYWMDRMLDEFV